MGSGFPGGMPVLGGGFSRLYGCDQPVDTEDMLSAPTQLHPPPSGQPPLASPPGACGVVFQGSSKAALQQGHWQLMEQLQQLGLASLVDVQLLAGDATTAPAMQVALQPTLIEHWAPGHDTRALSRTLALDPRHADDLAREIVVALLLSPVAFTFPSHAEWAAAVRVRQGIVQAARDTRLHPDPTGPRHPPEDWQLQPGHPPLLRPERPLTAALQALLQPAQGPGFALSPYRASEYVLLLGLAEETLRHHPALYSRLQVRFQHRPVRDCEFHQALMRQIGSPEAPLPSGFAVPGDRVWLRPPPSPGMLDTRRPIGGRWAIYLGQGQYREFETPPDLSRQPPWHSPEHTAAWLPMREFPRLLCPGSSDILL